MTEVMVSNMTPVNGEKIGWAGPPMPNVLAKVVDVDTGEPLPPNTNGEICIKTPSVRA